MDKPFPTFASALPHGSHGFGRTRETPCRYSFKTREGGSRFVRRVQNITPPRPSFVSECQGRILGSTSKRSDHAFPAIFLPRSGKAKQQRTFQAIVVFNRLFAYGGPQRTIQFYIDYSRTAGSCMQSILSENRLDHWTTPPVFSREKSMMPRQLLQCPRFLPRRTGLGHLISAKCPDANTPGGAHLEGSDTKS